MTDDERKRVAWENYWNGWNDCADAVNQPMWRRILNIAPANIRDGGPNKPADPEEG